MLGRAAFLEKYRFQPSRKYTVLHAGKEYDSKPLLAAAYGIRFPERGPLENNFSGGKEATGRIFLRLGFEVTGIAPKISDWTLQEVEHVVEAYKDLLVRSRREETFVKTQEAARVANELPNRNKSAVLRKFGNISAILKGFQQPWIGGFTPQANVQTLLEAVIYDKIEEGGFLNKAVIGSAPSPIQIDYEPEVAPPSAIPLPERERNFGGTKVDFAKRQKAQRELGRRGEKWALRYLRQLLGEEHQVIWSSEKVGDGLGYDIEVWSPGREPTYYEVKTTTGDLRTPFHVSSNEVAASIKLGSRYRLMRIFDFPVCPKFYILKGPINSNCSLKPDSFSALPI